MATEIQEMHMRPTVLALSALSLLALSACGTDPGDRALSGAGIGAAAGAVIGAPFGAPALGAVVGAAAGGVTGAVTSPSQVDLGRPVWRNQ
jgi:osmotically inducible lipoprotein OsmB